MSGHVLLSIIAAWQDAKRFYGTRVQREETIPRICKYDMATGEGRPRHAKGRPHTFRSSAFDSQTVWAGVHAMFCGEPVD